MAHPQPRPLARPPRDLRLDVARGWLQVSIFGAHAVGSAFGAYGIHAAWGLSDSSEQFLFLSGFVLASVFALKTSRDGALAAARDTWARTARLWVKHMALFVLFGAMILWAERTLPLHGETDRLAWGLLTTDPLTALWGAATLLYLPNYIDILPVFILAMLALPGFLWLAARIGAWALLPSAVLWAGVQVGAWQYWGWMPVGLDPLAWQFVFVLGAWFGRRALLEGAAVRRHGWAIALCVVIILAGFLQRLGEGLESALVFDVEAIWTLAGKTHLGPLALLHGLAIAYLVAVLIPREARWMHHAIPQAMAAVGRHSLDVFCIGLFLSWGVSAGLRLHPDQWWLDPVLTLAGIGLLVGFAVLRERRRFCPAPVR
jgi:hypothetical protein